jgi:hypothetical protein
MSIFNKENGTITLRCIPFHKTKKFLDMSKTTKNNPVLQRNGAKISYELTINELHIFPLNPNERINRKFLNINNLMP